MITSPRPFALAEIRNRYLLLADALGLAGALFLAYALRFESLAWHPDHVRTFVIFLAISLPVKLTFFYLAGLYRRLWRYAGVAELEHILMATLVAMLCSVLLGAALLPWAGVVPVRVPLSVLAMDSVFTAGVVALSRFVLRVLRHWAPADRSTEVRRVLVAGAGAAGESLVRELRANPRLGLRPVAFVDDDPAKHRKEMCGLPVLGATAQLADLQREHAFDELIIAMPSAPGSAIRSVTREAREAGLAARTVPGLSEIFSGRVSVSSLRPVQIEDLLRREPVVTDLDQVRALIEGETVLVTGAGGSIGSELCRQVTAFAPGRLLLLGHGENSIFDIHRELEERFPQLTLVPIIADIRDQARIQAIFRRHRPAVVLHAAAHKHVPLMEWNVVEAVTNNVIGTRNVVEAAIAAGTSHMLLISTDKAVCPTNVMGATKRVAEQLVQEAARRTGRHFIAVRFGNVLGSRGSVLPNFLRQIEAGGPITVTHPEMRRYFMTIPESVQLVLQAAVLGQGGEVFVLDMGEPVKIVDLARDLIRLSGLEVDRDIEIKFTGVRPGEKL
ncbi:MAG: polysaccharide biosynthesis protein, partial [Gemmatimonadales bacterium]